MASDTAIMEPLEEYEQDGRYNSKINNKMAISSISSCSRNSVPDVLSGELTSLNLHGGAEDKKAFKLLDEMENLMVASDSQFSLLLGTKPDTRVKVVTILGNTGEGKSYTLNNTFFGGEDVFTTSNLQESCTVGVWTSFDPLRQILLLDTEGMLGQADNENMRTRMLLKVLAVSDIIIYRTRAERLHNDLFYFLGDASRSYSRHFSKELEKINREGKIVRSQIENSSELGPSVSQLGPSVVIFHETIHTEPLTGPDTEGVLRTRFTSMNQDISSFSKLVYIGVRTDMQTRTSFKPLLDIVSSEVSDTTVRSPRNISHVYKALVSLNSKFSGDVSPSHRSFPDQYFTCQSTCQSCEGRCCKQIKHTGDHSTDTTVQCTYSAQLENKVYTCRYCQENGRRCVVVPKAAASKESSWVGLAKFAWSGFVLECQRCGVIYRSRQQWFGNLDPETQGVVQTHVAHVWPGVRSLQGTQNAARRLLDGVTAISGSVTEVSGAPAVSLARWAADQVAPSYWKPNSEIVSCHSCSTIFSGTCKIHHCRKCGDGFCDTCSNYQKPVPEKGWGLHPVRVCKLCSLVCDQSVVHNSHQAEPKEVQVRKVGESVLGTVSSLANTLEIPISLIKDSARPEYWVPDSEINSCAVCDNPIGPKAPVSQESTSVHHCRQCGQGVCNKCSLTRRIVSSRGWDVPVRVCDDCLMTPETE